MCGLIILGVIMFGHGLLCFFTNIKIGAGGATSMLPTKNFCDECVKQADGLSYTYEYWL